MKKTLIAAALVAAAIGVHAGPREDDAIAQAYIGAIKAAIATGKPQPKMTTAQAQALARNGVRSAERSYQCLASGQCFSGQFGVMDGGRSADRQLMDAQRAVAAAHALAREVGAE